MSDRDAMIRELEEARAENARLREALDQWENREAAWCPEHVAFDEYIAHLQDMLVQYGDHRFDCEPKGFVEDNTPCWCGFKPKLDDVFKRVRYRQRAGGPDGNL